MANIPNKMDILNLKQIAQYPSGKQKTVGIILDATRPYKTSASKDYITKLKIIDDTININQPNNLPAHKAYIQIFIFTKTVDEAPWISRIGDIIYLKRYDFSRFNGSELKGTRNQYASGNCYIFDGTPGASFDIIASDQLNQEINNPLNEQLQERIEQLRVFQQNFFSNKSLTTMAWYGIQIIDSTILKQSDFDMILKITEKQSSEKEGLKRFTLVDGKHNIFYINFFDQDAYTIGSLVKIRSIPYINEKRELEINDYSSICQIPDYFYDHQLFKELTYTVVMPEDQAQIMEDESHGLNEYSQKGPNFISQIRKKYRTQQYEKKTDLKTLIDQAEKYNESQKVQYDGKKYRVECYVIDVQPSNIKNSLVYLCKSCKKSYSFLLQDDQKCCGKDPQLILEFFFIVKDASIDTLPLTLELYVYPFDQNPSEIFPGIDTSNINNENVEEYNEYYKVYTNYIFENTGLDQQLELIVTPMFYQNNMIYRIVDTKANDIIQGIEKQKQSQEVRQQQIQTQFQKSTQENQNQI